jgi:putative ABC transport system substrate-binding protein
MKALAIRASALLAAVLAFAFAAHAQAPSKFDNRPARVGWLGNSAPKSVIAANHDRFIEGLRDLGYVEGRNLVVERRWAEGRLERLPALAEELAGKRLELLKELVPGLARVAIAYNPNDQNKAIELRETRGFARGLGLAVEVYPMPTDDSIEPAFLAMKRDRMQALVTFGDPFLNIRAARLAALARQHRMPAAFPFEIYAEAGGLMSCGANLAEAFYRAAGHVDRILRGAAPGDLPIELPTRFEMVLNLKAAEEMSLAIPPTFLLRADRVIQ